MASRNALKVDVAEQFYHVYNRGVEKRVIFQDSEDFSIFLKLLKRYLDIKPHKDIKGREYPWLKDKVELVAFCLMPNHFHLLLYQAEATYMEQLIRNICTTYTAYFNKKYQRVGHLFQGVYRASMISDDSYCQHISRYIHLNPKDYRGWEYSSLPYYFEMKQAAWIQPERILAMFDSREEYGRFLQDYEDQKRIMDELKYELADGVISFPRFNLGN